MIENEKPTRIDSEGTQRWEVDGKPHRLNDLPAIIYSDGEKSWWMNGKLHRENNPAIINSKYQAWYKNGLLHREDGPAIIRKHSDDEYYINGDKYDTKKFFKRMNDKLNSELPKKTGNNEKKIKI